MALNSMTALASIKLTGPAANISFSSIPNTYRDLVLIYSAKIDNVGSEILIRLNNDSSSNYLFTHMYGTGATATAQNQTNAGLTTGGPVGPTPNAAQIDFIDYAVAGKRRTFLMRSDNAAYSSNTMGHVYQSTSEISSILFYVANGYPFVAGSKFTLYGRTA